MYTIHNTHSIYTHSTSPTPHSTCGGHSGHGPVEAVEVVVGVASGGVDQVCRAGPCVGVAGLCLAAQDVPDARHKVRAHRDEHCELDQTQ